GFGLEGAVTGITAKVIRLVNESRKPVIAADIPSGVVADSGEVKGPAVKASVTITFSSPKLGLILHPGAEYAGRVIIADIGIPRSFAEEASDVRLNEAKDLKNLLPRYAPDQNKWSRGGVLVIAGSPGSRPSLRARSRRSNISFPRPVRERSRARLSAHCER
ncbi:MAG: hypothetical protein M1335_05180, partial [Chloroflexi bacterium]|nr:hypothetical protein [Chloroflexota bacterium]